MKKFFRLKIISKIISILFIFVQLFLIISIIDFADININAVENDISNINMTPIISAPMVNITDSITVTYQDINAVDFDLEYVCDGITTIVTEDEEFFEIEISAIDNEEYGMFNLNATNNNGSISTHTLYTYNSGDKLYISEFSKDHALYIGLQDMYDSNILSEAECENKYAEFTSQDIIKTDFIDWIVEGTVTTVSGRIKWEISNTPDLGETDNPTLPMRNTLVQVGVKIDEIFIPWASGYTDAEGNYNIEIDHSGVLDGADLYIRVKLEAHTILLATDWFFDHYFYEEKVIEHNLEAGTVIQAKEHILRYDSNSWLYKATYVHQAMVIGERFAEEMGFETSRIVRVAFPGGRWDSSVDDDLKDSAFCGGNVFDSSYSAISIEKYNDIDTLVHEYSHFVQISMGNYGVTLVDIMNFDPTHDSESDYYAQKGDKSFAMHLSWTEGWGYVFSAMSQKYYIGQYNNMQNYDVDLGVNDYMKVGNYLGEFQEASVGCFLWSLVDQMKITSNSAGAGDYKLPWTPQEWWDMTTVSGTCRLPDFINLIENESYNLGVDIDYKQIKEFVAEKLTTYNIAPKILSAYKDKFYDAFVITFEPNGSSSYPNNRFVVKIYNENKEKIYESEEYIRDVSNTTNCLYLIDITDWNDIVSSVYCGQTIYISVEGYRYDANEDDSVKKSGPYYSEYFPYVLNSNHEYGYEIVDDYSHVYACETCAFEETQDHICNYRQYSSISHYVECGLCNYRGEKKHDFEEIFVDAGSHHLVCKDCGYTKSGSHNLKYVSLDSSLHSYKCNDCSYKIDTYHHLSHETVDEDFHRTTCSYCEYIKLNAHHWVKRFISATHHIETCFYCGVTTGTSERHSWKVSNDPRYVECSYCGHLKLKPTVGGGEIIPVQPFKEDDIEEETE